MTNPVVLGCTCPGSPHQADRIKLFDPLPFAKAIICRQTIAALFAGDEPPSEAEMSAAVFEVYLLHCVQAWTRTDAKRKALPLSRPALREFMEHWPVEAAAVADAANELYIDKVVLPLLQAALRSSPTTPTASETSPRSGRSKTPRTRSSQSSTTSTQTDGTGATFTSLDGGSSTSQSGTTAA